MKKVFCLMTVALATCVVRSLPARNIPSPVNGCVLSPAAMEPFPCGTLRPEGWLAHELGKMTEGVVGRLYETSAYLKPDNGWLNAQGKGWEEQPYWFRSFVKLAVLTGDRRCLDVARDWIEKILATQDADGWFGPQELKEFRPVPEVVLTDVWGHMVMAEALMSWYEHSHDERILTLLRRFFAFCDTLKGRRFCSSDDYGFWCMANKAKRQPSAVWKDRKLTLWHFDIQGARSGDFLPVLFRLYEMTRDPLYLRLADRAVPKARSRASTGNLWSHTVHFAQAFSYRPLYARRSQAADDRDDADFWYDRMMDLGGLVRGTYAADENWRDGFDDARQGCESCSFAELGRSFELLSDATGATRWGDRAEDILFNHAPAAYTPDWKKIHYITAPNQVQLEGRSNCPYANGRGMTAYSAVNYRCCLHNAGLAFPLFAENLVKRAADGALVVWHLAPHAGRANLSGHEVAWRVVTDYPFRETAKMELDAARPLTVRFRVPRWSRGFTVTDGAQAFSGEAGHLCEIPVKAGRTTLEVTIKAECELKTWPKTGAVSVERGPFAYSVALGEKYGRFGKDGKRGGNAEWTEEPPDVRGLPENLSAPTEVMPTSPWNWGVDLAANPVYRPLPMKADVFDARTPVAEITLACRRIPEWTLQDGQPAELQRCVALVTSAVETVRFVPLGCQRLRLSMLPRATDDVTRGARWRKTPAETPVPRPRQKPSFRIGLLTTEKATASVFESFRSNAVDLVFFLGCGVDGLRIGIDRAWPAGEQRPVLIDGSQGEYDEYIGHGVVVPAAHCPADRLERLVVRAERAHPGRPVFVLDATPSPERKALYARHPHVVTAEELLARCGGTDEVRIVEVWRGKLVVSRSSGPSTVIPWDWVDANKRKR